MPTTHLLVSTLLALLIAIPFPAMAMTEDGPTGEIHETNGARADINPSPVSNAGANQAMLIAPKPALPNAPTPQKVIDKKFIAVMAVLGGAETLRLTTHKLVLDNEFAAGAPWVTSVPSSPSMLAKYGGIFAGEMLVAYELKKPHDWLPGDKVIRKLWWVAPAALVAIHIKNGVRSIRTQGPGGCTSVAECEGQ
ncbi:MAG: hypothetical protein WA213_20535 [Terriglobales bacterium]